MWQREWELPGKLTLEASGISLQNFHRTGETYPWRAQTKPCAHQDPGERISDPTRDWPRLSCEGPGVSSRGMGGQWQVEGLEALSVAMRSWVFLKEIPIIFITSTIVLSQVKTGEREHSPTHQQKIGLKIYGACLHSSEQDPVAPQSFSSIRKLP